MPKSPSFIVRHEGSLPGFFHTIAATDAKAAALAYARLLDEWQECFPKTRTIIVGEPGDQEKFIVTPTVKVEYKAKGVKL